MRKIPLLRPALAAALLLAAGATTAAKPFPPGPTCDDAGKTCDPDQHTVVRRPGAVRIAQVYTDPGELPQLRTSKGGKTLDLPLKHTHVKAELAGFVARVEVTQTYGNPFEQPIEAVYVFPLPENSAVGDMRMVIGERIVQAEIKKREEARRTYEEAKREGHTAALLEQERPNVFTQSVANIEPGTDIDVIVSYLQDLSYDAGEYEFVFPMVVGPRFFPGAALDRPASGRGWAKDTDRVPDASRVSPPILGAGTRSGHDISIELVARGPLPIKSFDVPTHEVLETPTFDGSLALRLATRDAIPNRDFVLRYRVDGELPQVGVLSHGTGDGGYFSLVLQPPTLDIDELVGQREIVFVVDVSGSMHGVPLSMCKDAMRHALKNLRPVDTFNVITFAGRTGSAFAAARPANDANVGEALRYVDGLTAGGGTHLRDGVKAALSPNVGEGRHRYVFFLTDGYVGNENEILADTRALIEAMRGSGQRARVFGFGVGSSVNRMLLDGLSKAGDGTTVYATTREDPTLAVNTFYRFIDHAVLSDLRIDWGDLQVEEVYPTHVPDLFASRPTIVHGRYTGGGETTIVVRGTANARAVEIPVRAKLERKGGASPAMATLWARAKIEHLGRELWDGAKPQVVEAITELGLAHRLVTAYTSFVAVDRSKRVGGELRTIVQPVEAPEGVDPAMAAGDGAMALGGVGYGRGGGSSKSSLGRSIGGGPATMGPALAESLAPAPLPTATPQQRARDEEQQKRKVPAKSKRERRAVAGGTSVAVSGGLAPSAVQAVLDGARGELDRILAASSLGKSKRTALIVLRWFVTREGAAIQAKVLRSTAGDAELERRLTALVKKLRFPQPASAASVEVTWTITVPLPE